MLSIFVVMGALVMAVQTSSEQYHKITGAASQQDPDVAKEVLYTNVSIFNGTTKKLIKGKDFVLKRNKTAKIIPVGNAGKGYAH